MKCLQSIFQQELTIGIAQIEAAKDLKPKAFNIEQLSHSYNDYKETLKENT